MDKSEKTKERIVDSTIELINESGGDTEKVTIRSIAGRSGVSVGLINHYFGSKERLVEHCVQKIISGVIGSFKPQLSDENDRLYRVKYVAKQVMDFLMQNREISRISILGDMANPKARDNTMGTVRGFAWCISGGTPGEEERREAFLVTAFLQESFLRRDVLSETLGVDFYDKAERDGYIDGMIDKIITNGGQRYG